MVRVERAQTALSVSDVERILETYGGNNEALKLALIQVARDIRKRGWWTAYGDVLPDSFAELEDAAKKIRTWQLEVVPGLLQTEDYARELIRTGSDEAETDRRVQARLMRQTVLSRQNAPTLEVLLHEMALRSPVGGRDVIRTQLASLRSSARRPNISVRVLPATAGVRPGLGEGSFTMFGFPEPVDLDVVHLETVGGDLYLEEIEQVRSCSVKYERIADACKSEEESAEFISALIKE